MKNRPSAPDLFEDELSETLDRIAKTPELGIEYPSRFDARVRRVLMPRTRNHIYFTVESDDAAHSDAAVPNCEHVHLGVSPSSYTSVGCCGKPVEIIARDGRVKSCYGPPMAVSFFDLLSRLGPERASRLLGPRGDGLLRAGGKWEIDPEAAKLGPKTLVIAVKRAQVTIALDEGARGRLRMRCSACEAPCEHAGAALSFLLDEKMLLGLSVPREEAPPIEHLDAKKLDAHAIAWRMERARKEKMTLGPTDASTPWTDYSVTSIGSGRTYRVALRSFERGESYCSCPDFRKNTLGTCKHVLFALEVARSKFSAAQLRRPYRRKRISVSLRYGESAELVVRTPEHLDVEARKIIGADRDIEDVADLVRRIEALEREGHDVVVYPDAEEHIQRRLFEKRIASLVRDVRRAPDRHPLRKDLLKVELLPYQLDGIAFAAGAGRAVLADDMGLGKTIQAIGVAELLAREAGVQRVLVICPASLKSQWKNEIERFSTRNGELVSGSAEERAAQYCTGAFYTICNYEQVLRDIDAVERARWDLIVFDEAQRIKNWEAKTSRVMKGLSSRFALALTGTSLENRLEELHSVVEAIDERHLGPAFRFIHRHRTSGEDGKVTGYKNLDELRAKLRPILLRRTRAEVLRELPERTTEIVRITPTGEQLEAHEGFATKAAMIASKAYLTEMDLLRLRKALLGCRLAANGTYLVDKKPPGYSSKLEVLDELVERLRAEKARKAIIFSEWTTMLDLVEPLLLSRKLGFVRLDGSVPQKKRQLLVSQFHKDPNCRFFLSTNAGSTGLNLQAADTVINLDLPWNPAVLEQRIARAHRMGQKRPVHVFVLVTTDTIEEKLLATLSAKKDLFLAALDPGSGRSSVEIQSGMAELKRRLEVLLGNSPPAPLDASQQRRAHGDRVAEKTSELLRAALALAAELVPAESRGLIDLLRASAVAPLDPDESGRVRMSLTLPDPSEIQRLLQAQNGAAS